MKWIKRSLNNLLSYLGVVLIKKDIYKGLKTELAQSQKTNLELISDTLNIYKEFVIPNLSIEHKDIELLSNLIGTQKGEGIYILHTLKKVNSLSGDVCEFGVAQGATSVLIAETIKNTNKNLWLFDSFEGLPEPTEKDQLKDDIFNKGSMSEYAGLMSCPDDMVKGRLKNIDFPQSRTKIVKGFIEDTIHQDYLPKKVAFAYVDFDFYEPIKVALEFLHQIISINGFIIVDDYDWFSTGAKSAVDEFMDLHKDTYKLTMPYKHAGHFCLIQKVSNKI